MSRKPHTKKQHSLQQGTLTVFRNFRKIASKYFQHITINIRGDLVWIVVILPSGMSTNPSPAQRLANQTTHPFCSCLLTGRNLNGKHPPSGRFKAGQTNQILHCKTDFNTLTERYSGLLLITTSRFATAVNIAASLPDELNEFYSRFEAHNTVDTERAPAADAEAVSTFSISVADVTLSFRRVNIRKAAGPDGIPGRELKACAHQLAGVFTDIFNLSLSLSVVSSCFKTAKTTCLNDWCPVELTSAPFCLPHSTLWSLHTGAKALLLMPLLSPYTLLSPIWTVRTPMWECYFWTTAPHSTP